MSRINIFFVLLVIFSCEEEMPLRALPSIDIESPSDIDVVTDSTDFREFRVLDSRYLSKEEIWKDFNAELEGFNEVIYNGLKPIILEQDILALQSSIGIGEITYETLTKFYLYRIRKLDRENALSLNSVISINPYVLEEARARDKAIKEETRRHLIFGMPILLKDNINAANMPTTAGAVALYNNYAEDAFITKRLKEQGALILGKTNLSEWAYFFCGDCPSGYSAIGGQTLNPYGRRTIDTGGSSSGSGVSIAANFAVGAVGSETSGSILSPSSANSIVGIKPTIGLLSRSGIVPISSTLDTPGPMTRNVSDNAILLDAMLGYDASDFKAIEHNNTFANLDENRLRGTRLGAFKRLLSDSTYVRAIAQLKQLGAEVIEVDEEEIERSGFINILNLDMKKDLPNYISDFAHDSVSIKSVSDVIIFNAQDSINRAPYGQRLFKGIVDDKGTLSYLDSIKVDLKTKSKGYFDTPLSTRELDGFISINNWHAGWAALAEYPALTVPMGYTDKGIPRGLTFISKPLSERNLLEWALNYEQASLRRVPPSNYN